MNRVAIASGCIGQVLPLQAIAGALVGLLSRAATKAAADRR